MDGRPIGIFDSGVGGLTVAREVMKRLPNEDIIYFGDTARVPYGSKSKEIVTKFSMQIMRYLTEKGVKAVIIACGTASSNSYSEIVKEFEMPVFEMVGNGAAACVKATNNKVVGVIGTEGTIRSGAYEKAIRAVDCSVRVYSKACPLFAPLAEEGWTDNTVAHETARLYLSEFLEKDIDTIVLGCTHYPLLSGCIQKVLPNVTVVNPAEYAAWEVKRFLSENSMECGDGRKEGKSREGGKSRERLLKFYVSDNTDKFDSVARIVLEGVFKAEKVDIEKY